MFFMHVFMFVNICFCLRNKILQLGVSMAMTDGKKRLVACDINRLTRSINAINSARQFILGYASGKPSSGVYLRLYSS